MAKQRISAADRLQGRALEAAADEAGKTGQPKNTANSGGAGGRKVITVHVEAGQHEALRRMAFERRVSMQSLARSGLDAVLDGRVA